MDRRFKYNKALIRKHKITNKQMLQDVIIKEIWNIETFL